MLFRSGYISDIKVDPYINGEITIFIVGEDERLPAESKIDFPLCDLVAKRIESHFEIIKRG